MTTLVREFLEETIAVMRKQQRVIQGLYYNSPLLTVEHYNYMMDHFNNSCAILSYMLSELNTNPKNLPMLPHESVDPMAIIKQSINKKLKEDNNNAK